MAKIGIEPEIIPTSDMRRVVQWCLDYYFRTGRLQAPSRDAILSDWRSVIEDNEIDLGDGTETDDVAWAIESLKAQYIYGRASAFNLEFGTALAKSEPYERLALLDLYAQEMFGLVLSLQDRTATVEGPQGFTNALREYEARVARGGLLEGIQFGLPEVDAHFFGLHPGELGVLAGIPKVGKSFFLLLVAWFMYRMLHAVVVLYTLENSVPMTYDRLACMATGIDYSEWQQGNVPPEIIDTRIRPLIEQMQNGDEHGGRLIVIQPEPGKRDPANLVRGAQLLGCNALLIDQLTFVEAPETEQRGRSKNEEVRDIMRLTKILISAPPNPISCLMAHQINREGQKAADRVGHLEMYHLADGSEVERASDLVLALYQNGDDAMFGHVKLQTLASRRRDIRHWNLLYRPWAGVVQVLGEVTFA